MMELSSGLGRAAAVSIVVCALGAAPGARADVGLQGSQTSIAHADIGSAPSPPYRVTNDVIADPPWVILGQSDPVALSGSQSRTASAEAWYQDPFDTTPPYDLLPVPLTASSFVSVVYNAAAGQLSASATAVSSVMPASYTAVAPDSRPPVFIPNPYLAGGMAGVGIYYDDEITFTSSTLPIGAPIEIELTVHHSVQVEATGGLGGGPPYPNHAFSESRLGVGVYDPDWQDTGQGANPLSVLRVEVINNTLVASDPSSAVFDFNVRVGDHFYLQHNLRVWARATADATAATAGSLADASNAAGVYLRSLTPGVAIEALSGQSYADPVPEPGAALLQGAALLALAGLRRRAR